MTNILDMYSKEELIKKIDDVEIDVIPETEEESGVFNSELDSKRKLYIDRVDKSTSDIMRMIKENELILQPDYQR